jgi:hypothetical protein
MNVNHPFLPTIIGPDALTWQAFTNPINHFGWAKPNTRKLVLKAKVKVVYRSLGRAI